MNFLTNAREKLLATDATTLSSERNQSSSGLPHNKNFLPQVGVGNRVGTPLTDEKAAKNKVFSFTFLNLISIFS